jgi:hypothetical protein
MTFRYVGFMSLLVGTLLLTACGGHHQAAPSTTAQSSGTGNLNQSQALELASVLYDDYRAGGALVSVNVPYQTGTQVTIDGQVDFQHHEGHLTVTTVVAGQGTSVENVDYTINQVFEQGGPVVSSELARYGHPGQSWVARQADPANRPLDKIIEILVSLASPSRDNPLLIQESHARYLGQVDVDGVETDSFQYDPAITYFVDPANGVLRQFVASVQGFAGPVTVEVADPGPRSLPPPPAGEVLHLSEASSPTTTTAGQ